MGTNNEDIKGLTEELPFETAESTKADRSIRAN